MRDRSSLPEEIESAVFECLFRSALPVNFCFLQQLDEDNIRSLAELEGRRAREESGRVWGGCD